MKEQKERKLSTMMTLYNADAVLCCLCVIRVLFDTYSDDKIKTFFFYAFLDEEFLFSEELFCKF